MKAMVIQSSVKNKMFIILLGLIFMLMLTACGADGFDPLSIFNPATETPTVTSTLTPTATFTVTNTNTATPEPTFTETPTETATNTPPPTSTNTFTSSPTYDGTITETSTPTITLTPSRTPTATRTRYPTWTPRPTNTRRPTNTPTITPTPTPPLAFNRINNLAPYSLVVSPVRVEAIVSPGDDGLIYVTLIGENGRTISREGLNFRNYIGSHVGIAHEIPFTPIGAAETARIEISSYDRYNRTMAVTSVDLVLLQLGRNEITRPTDLTEPYLIREPDEGDTIRGGLIQVQGLARILNANPLIVECIDEDGNILSREEVNITAPSDEFSHIPFQVYLGYSVSEATNVRLTIKQESDSRIPGIISLNSFEIILAP